MKEFGGPAIFLDRNDINTDEIIPAKYLTEISRKALKPFILEDLKLTGFDPQSEEMRDAQVIITRANFGCGSSREHAVWVLEVNDINMVIGKSFARIFRQNMFNCGMLAIELPAEQINTLFSMEHVVITVDLNNKTITAAGKTGQGEQTERSFPFELNPFDRELILAGGWLEYADKKY